MTKTDGGVKRLRYVVDLEGCDDVTRFTVYVDEREAQFLRFLAAQSVKYSEYTCMPRMKVMTEAQQQTITDLLNRLRADGFDVGALETRPLAEEAGEFHRFDAEMLAEAGEGAIVVFRPTDWPVGVECEIPEQGLVIDTDGRMITEPK